MPLGNMLLAAWALIFITSFITFETASARKPVVKIGKCPSVRGVPVYANRGLTYLTVNRIISSWTQILTNGLLSFRVISFGISTCGTTTLNSDNISARIVNEDMRKLRIGVLILHGNVSCACSTASSPDSRAVRL
ncbi:hypothetical protein PoB_005473700 [Plakobranchus ocellatus]|uniref:Uncharacterized protein n=1 Tax=Plakobranchus ocellatus TaxID=259542 RepID=A0AAV4CAD1_9GAST|nr:hypothetical protein PoB_005473700 [Plakobranchus ocellatus]